MEDNNEIDELKQRLEFAQKLIDEKEEEINALKKNTPEQLIKNIALPLTRFVNLGYSLPEGNTRMDFLQAWDALKSRLKLSGIVPIYHYKGEILEETNQAKLRFVPTPVLADSNKVCRCLKMGFDFSSGGLQEELEIYSYDETAEMPDVEKAVSSPAQSAQNIFTDGGDYPLEYGKDIEFVNNYSNVVLKSQKFENLFKINQHFNPSFRFISERALLRQRNDGQREPTKHNLAKALNGGEHELISPLFSEKPRIKSYRFMLIDGVIKLMFFSDGMYLDFVKIVDLAEINRD